MQPGIGETTVVATGEFDLATAATLAEALEAACDTGLPVRLDVTAVTFLDAWSMRTLARTRHHLSGRGMRLSVVHPRPLVRQVLELGGFAELLTA